MDESRIALSPRTEHILSIVQSVILTFCTRPFFYEAFLQWNKPFLQHEHCETCKKKRELHQGEKK